MNGNGSHQHHDERGGEKFVLRAEVAVDGAEGDLGSRRDVAHLHCVVAALRRQLEGGVEDARPPGGLAGGQRGEHG